MKGHEVTVDIGELKKLQHEIEQIGYRLEDLITPAPTIEERWASDGNDLFSGAENLIRGAEKMLQDDRGGTPAVDAVVPSADLRVKALERMVVILANRLQEAVQRVPNQFVGDPEFIAKCLATLGWEKTDIRLYFQGEVIPMDYDGIEDFEHIVEQHIVKLQQEASDGTSS